LILNKLLISCIFPSSKSFHRVQSNKIYQGQHCKWNQIRTHETTTLLESYKQPSSTWK